MHFRDNHAIPEDLAKPIPEHHLKDTISMFRETLPNAKAILTRIENIELRNSFSKVIDACEFIYQKLQSGSPADVNTLLGYLKERHSTVAEYLARLILTTVNVLGDLSHKKRAGVAKPSTA